MGGTTRRPALLYLSINDGTDTRINKEIITLSRAFAVDFVGISTGAANPFVASRVRQMEVVVGRRRSPTTLIRFFFRIWGLLRRNRYDSVHVINENLYLLLWPLLFGQRVVLDVFDSMFLKMNDAGWGLRRVQGFCYARPAKIIVTDEERAQLMPETARKKLVILPNYPFRFEGPVGPRVAGELRVLYAGSLSDTRGTIFIEQLLAAAEDLKVVMAGWLYDERSRELSRHPRVEWLGTIPQQEIIARASRCDFILCHYEPVTLNNIYASPNKIYDAIQAGAAVIINPEVRVSRFVLEYGLGVVLDAYQPADMTAVARSLRNFKSQYQPDPALRERFLWESVESRLLAAHGQNADAP